MQDRKARLTNQLFGGVNLSEAGKKGGPLAARSRRDFNSILKAVETAVVNQGYQIPYREDPVRSALVWSFLRVALRDNDEDPEVFCPKCRKRKKVHVTAVCPDHPDDGELDVVVPNEGLEKNSITAGSKVFDKMYPNLQAVGGTINVEGTITTISAEIVKVIIEYVPGEKRQECLRDIDKLIEAAKSDENS